MAKYLRNIINIFLFYLSCHKMVGTFKIITMATSVEEKIQILSSDGMLVKRPLLELDDTVLIGFKEKEWNNSLGI